jgi:hypothetical protein
MRVKIDKIDFHIKLEEAEALIAVLLLDTKGTISFSNRSTGDYYSVNKIGPHDTYDLWEYKKNGIKYIAKQINCYSRYEIYNAFVTGEFY